MADRVRLENADDNTCFGCGPDNPMGLRLEFFREGDRVVTDAQPTKWWAGMPGVVNPGILFAILQDLVQWGGDAFLHRVGLLGEVHGLAIGPASTERPLHAWGELVERNGRVARFRCVIEQDGRPVAEMERDLNLVTRKEFEAAMPMVETPGSLDGYFEEA